MKYKLYSPEQGHAMMLRIWVEAKELLTSNKKLVIEVKEETRSNEQNALIHALIARIAKQAEHAGSKWEPEDWKRLLLAMCQKIWESSFQALTVRELSSLACKAEDYQNPNAWNLSNLFMLGRHSLALIWYSDVYQNNRKIVI